MLWWKVGLLATLGWVLILIVLSGGMLWYVASHPMGEKIDDARDEKAGEAVGMLLAGGSALIWFYAYRLKKRSES